MTIIVDKQIALKAVCELFRIEYSTELLLAKDAPDSYRIHPVGTIIFDFEAKGGE